MGFAVGALAPGQAAAAVTPGTHRNQVHARADAAAQLAALSLPPGASRVRSDPSVGSTLDGYGWPGPERSPATIDDHQYWRVPGDPQDVEAWVRGHAPSGSQVRSSGLGPGQPSIYYVCFKFPTDAGHVDRRTLIVEVTSARGGGSAVRADAAATWVLEKPRWEHVPASAHVVTAWLSLGGSSSRTVTFTSREQVARIKRVIDHEGVKQPEFPPPCPAHAPESVTLVFRARAGGPVLARAGLGPDCPPGMGLSVRGRRGPELWFPEALWTWLLHIGVVGQCSRGQLALKNAGVRLQGSQHLATLQIVDTGRHTCEFKRGATVRLLGARERPLPIPIGHRGVLRGWLIAPRDSVDVSISWTSSCHRNQVAAVRLSIAGSPPPLATSIKDRRRFTPCKVDIAYYGVP